MRIIRPFVVSHFIIVSLSAHIHVLPKPGEEKVGCVLLKSYKNGERMVVRGKSVGGYSTRRNEQQKLNSGMV